MGLEKIYENLKKIPVIDTHEHLWDEQYRLEHPGDWSSLFFHYGEIALKVAGLKQNEADILFDPNTTHNEKWDIFNKYFPYCKNVAYIKSVVIAIADIYGIDRIDCDSMEELTQRMKDEIKPGFHRKVLRDLGGIEYCMVNCFDKDSNGERYPARLEGDIDLLRPDLFVDNFMYPVERKLIERITGIETGSFSNWLKAVDSYFEMYASSCCSIKIALAYRGSLDFKQGVSYRLADGEYQKLMETHFEYKDVRALADYMFYYIVNKSAEYQLPLKFHTGLYYDRGYAVNGEMELNIRHLSRIAMERPECDFIAMHIGYPFQDELVMAIRQIPNLYADMSWAWVVDPAASAQFLKQALTAAPVTKITGFGGDYSFVENTYGHLQITRMQIAQVLRELVEQRFFGEDEASVIGSYLMKHSAERLYSKRR